jgi:hypothetical protein
MTWNSADWRNLVTIIALWVLVVLIVNPIGDFPLVDEWAYVAPVRSLVEGRGLVFSPFTAPNLLSQVVWGWGFGSVFGFSYNVMRLSTLVIASIGIMAFYGWLRLIPTTPSVALFGALVLMLNPIFVALSFTFMSDIFFLSFLLVSMFFLTRAMAGGTPASATAGWLAGIAAQLCRQLGTAIPIGAAVGRVTLEGFKLRVLVKAAIPVIAFLAVQRGYEYWLATTGRTPLMHGYNIDLIRERLAEPLGAILHEAGNAIVYLFFYVGLFIVPVSIFLFRTEWSNLSRRGRALVWSLGSMIAIVSMVLAAVLEGGMPLWGDAVTDWGVGGQFGGMPGKRTHIRVFLTVLGGVGGALGSFILLSRIWQHLRHEIAGRAAMIRSFPFVTALTIWAPVPILVMRFDRYLLPVVACLIVVVLTRIATASKLPSLRSPEGYAAMVVTALIGGYSVLGTKDFMASSRAREAALAIAMEQGVPRDQIDAGWVLNGRDLYPSVGSPVQVFTWYNDPVIRVDYRLHPGYAKIAEVPVGRSMPVNDPPLIVQRRVDEAVNYIGPRTRREIDFDREP